MLGIANFMKMAYLTWNKDAVTYDQILTDLKTLSNGELELPADTVLTKLDFKTPAIHFACLFVQLQRRLKV